MKPRYTVIWSKSARHELAEIWLRAADRKSLSRTIDDLDAALKSSPTTVGQEVPDGLRIALLPGLRILFSVSEDDRMVNVVLIRETR